MVNYRNKFFIIRYFKNEKTDRVFQSIVAEYSLFFQLFFALAVPLDDPTSTMSVALFLEAEYKLPSDVTEIELANGASEDRVKRNNDRRRTIDRGTVYAMLESKFESSV